MRISISFEMAKVQYRAAINSFVYQLGADGTKLLKEEMRLLLRDIMRFTPPKTREQGENAVAGDLKRNAFPLRHQDIDDFPRMREVVLRRDLAAIQAIANNIKKGFWGNRTLLTSIAQVQDAHMRNRTSYGRVRSDKRNMVMGDVWDQYAAKVQGAVGYARAGWASAADAVGLRLPKWVRRHAGKAGGGYIPPTPERLQIEAINRASKIPNYETRVVQGAVKMRAASMQSELRRLVGGGKSRRGSLAETVYGQAAD